MGSRVKKIRFYPFCCMKYSFLVYLRHVLRVNECFWMHEAFGRVDLYCARTILNDRCVDSRMVWCIVCVRNDTEYRTHIRCGTSYHFSRTDQPPRLLWIGRDWWTISAISAYRCDSNCNYAENSLLTSMHMFTPKLILKKHICDYFFSFFYRWWHLMTFTGDMITYKNSIFGGKQYKSKITFSRLLS